MTAWLDVTALELLHSRLEELADDMDSADPMKGPGTAEFADRLRSIWRAEYARLTAPEPETEPRPEFWIERLR